MINSKFGNLIGSLQIKQNPIVSSKFIMTTNHYVYQNIHATLYDDFIIIESKKNSYSLKIQFNFDLIFDVHSIQKKKNSTSSQMTLIRSNHWIQFQNNSNPQEFAIWVNHLKKRLNQRGFHQKYKPIKKLGNGSFVNVYLVQRISDGNLFAAKAFLKQAAFSVVNQITIMRKLQHRNLVKIQEVFQTQNSLYVVSQLLQGGQLYSILKSNVKILDINDIKHIMKSIIEGLIFMHQKHIMHRDLKPQNILFWNNQNQPLQCVLGDFGLAENTQNRQFIYTRCGTPGYVAPQIINIKDQKRQKYNQKCDMFSLGIVFHQLLFKKSPFQGRNFNDIILQNRNCQIDFTKIQYQRLQRSCFNLLKALLQKNPKERISAKDALHHQFFSQENLIKKNHFYEKEVEENINQTNDYYTQTLGLTQNQFIQEKKQIFVTYQDSLGDFHIPQSYCKAATTYSISSKDNLNSPNLKKTDSNKKKGQSRFSSIKAT